MSENHEDVKRRKIRRIFTALQTNFKAKQSLRQAFDELLNNY
jgi:hypothetical protein